MCLTESLSWKSSENTIDTKTKSHWGTTKKWELSYHITYIKTAPQKDTQTDKNLLKRLNKESHKKRETKNNIKTITNNRQQKKHKKINKKTEKEKPIKNTSLIIMYKATNNTNPKNSSKHKNDRQKNT